MKKKLLVLSGVIVSMAVVAGAAIAMNNGIENNLTARATDGVYWNHYARVLPTLSEHGSAEFWANCSTHAFTLVNPGGGEDIREGVAFNTTSYFDELDEEDPRYLPPLSERVDIKAHLTSLLGSLSHDPYSYIPNGMRPEHVEKVLASDVDYDFSSFTNVSDIKYGGFGEQWHMVIENIQESQTFYNITNYGSEILAGARTVAYAFLDDYYKNTVTKTFTDGETYTSKLVFNGTTMTYNLQYLSGVSVPLFGTVTPQIDMEYVIGSGTKTVRIQLGANNALKFVITPDSYTFGLEYGVTEVSRKALFSISRDEFDNVEGHIYEFVQLKDKDLVPSCADFYIDEDYASIVGNKASGLPAFTNYINELYRADQGKLLGYEIQETLSKIQYNTLWFNLNNITGISNIKFVDSKFYVNNSASEFENKKVGISDIKKSTSRRFDIENRLQYFYDAEDNEYETSIPMMFIQEEQLATFSTDINSVNDYITASVNLLNTYLTKIQSDYVSLVPVFATNKDLVDSAAIVDFIGEAAELA